MENLMHLSDELMAKLIDKRIEEIERNKYLNHLSQCQDCFEVYAESLKSLISGVSEEQKKRMFIVLFKRRRYLKLMAAMVIFISIVFIWNVMNTSSQKPAKSKFKKISVANGINKTMTLADGTTVVLDSGSLFHYPPEFGNRARYVHLKGEGYFKVTPDKERSFIVYANHAVIKVIGTEFNIRAWDHTKRVEVAVAEGKVLLGSREVNTKNTVGVIKGQVGTIYKNEEPSTPRKGDIENHLGWLHRDMVFDNVPLEDILFQLERWYNIRFSFEENISLSDHLTIHLQDKPIKTILDLISDLTDLKYKLDGNRVSLYWEDKKNF